MPACSGVWDNITCWRPANVGETVTVPCPKVFSNFYSKAVNGMVLRLPESTQQPDGFHIDKHQNANSCPAELGPGMQALSPPELDFTPLPPGLDFTAGARESWEG
ncbi:hypothetical protein P7K49_026167 [Saguinus oedipus]|uniref:G-protein coupled receptors family 2 profile 1 domain-containing protein n=1 Tax=Saguinus oedipus TaxID=9490 RepID=A0ABQ9UKS6_SAGOE|nr:hypothetical protein P7K49_026167 [Saguinus oedipus]